jgi:hypothetical protein
MRITVRTNRAIDARDAHTVARPGANTVVHLRAHTVARRLGRFTMALLGVAVLALALGSQASAKLAAGAYRVQRICGTPRVGSAACLAETLIPESLTPADLQADASRRASEAARGVRPAVTYESPFPGFLTPERLHAAYSLPTETASSSSQTIAVIDAYNDPSAESDLGVYDNEFGLPTCTKANGCFKKVNEEGKESPLPATEDGWAAEISIDVQMAHAICQHCHVLLVEAKSEEFTDLGSAVNAAVKLGATEVSNSYGGAESSTYSGYNTTYYNHPETVITASSGDCGYLNKRCRGESVGADFPADSPDVVAVGGTALEEVKGTWESTVWTDGGSGCSSVFDAPLWQTGVANFSATGCGSGRSIADVSAIADPETGVDIYNSNPYEGITGWGVWGGTSVASPIVAAEFGLAGGAHGVSYPTATLYLHVGESSALYDVVSGSTGSCKGATSCTAAVGYDGPSGVGSPIGLAAFSDADAPAEKTPPTISGLAEEGETLTEHHGEWTNAPSSYEYQWEDCNASGESCSPIAKATGQTYQLTSSDVGSTIRVQEIAINEAGHSPPALSARTATVSSGPTLTSFTPSSGITGSEVTVTGTGYHEASRVVFGKLEAIFKIVSATEIEATVPNGAVAGKISLTTPHGSVTSSTKFTPTLSITHLTPTKAAAGKTVSIAGVGFTSSSRVSFDGTPATSVSFVSAKRLKATVPAGAATGTITVTNTTAPLGTVSSAGAFTVT